VSLCEKLETVLSTALVASIESSFPTANHCFVEIPEQSLAENYNSEHCVLFSKWLVFTITVRE
jgi:hypothetical protein